MKNPVSKQKTNHSLWFLYESPFGLFRVAHSLRNLYWNF
ncbi:conserved hypothetical protein [delta proteobacterium NaphS2]|nr:conserved hypothetical protein [delta proteobacterium NaphS2]